MKVALVSENGLFGKVPKDFTNARTEFAWAYNLDADMVPLAYINNITTDYDLIILIIPKKINSGFDVSFVDLLSEHSNKVAVMQEGPYWNFQDLDLPVQIWYSNEYASADYIFCHNESDAKYYRGIYQKPVMVLQTAMVPYTIRNFAIRGNRVNTIIGGNFCSWYGGFDSYMVAQECDTEIYAPSMGRKKQGESHLLRHLPYMNWTDWMKTLSTFKYGVHLMRTFAAGTFAMNCAYYNIPCIGYGGLDTQSNLHPHTTVDIGDIESARSVARRLKEDSGFYDECVESTKHRINDYTDRTKWVENFQSSFLRIGK